MLICMHIKGSSASAHLCRPIARRLWGADDLSAAPQDEMPPAEAEVGGWPPAAPGAAPPRVALRSAAGLAALRAQIVPRLLRTLHGVLSETARQTGEVELMRASLYMAELLADERYRLYEYFDKEELRQILTQSRSSASPLSRCSAPAWPVAAAEPRVAGHPPQKSTRRARSGAEQGALIGVAPKHSGRDILYVRMEGGRREGPRCSR